MVINRRDALALTATGVLPVLGGSAEAPVKTEADPKLTFAHGVASGDPLQDRIILWTRVNGFSAPQSVNWEISETPDFKTLVAKGAFTTDASRDYTVKVDVVGLRPGKDYVYRFRTGKERSPVGRTRTLPQKADRVVLAVASCSLHPNGYFNAYQAIADLAELDCVVHLGDYIYEYGAAVDDYGMNNGLKLNRLPEPAHEIVSLEDYRMRHAQYKRDTALQAAHARAPWICVFDDHELCNNPWKDGAENHDPDKGEGDFYVRKAAALKAYAEWMPIRDPEAGKLREAIYRQFRFGNLAELLMLETRLVARTKQLEYSTDLNGDVESFRVKLNDPSRELLGETERQWLKTGLEQSVKAGVRWQVIGSQMIMAKVAGPDIVKELGPEKVEAVIAALPERPKRTVKAMAALFSGPIPMPFNLDAWDGYPAERERVYDMIKASGARAIVVSGDSHCAWANSLHDQAGKYVAAEIGVTAITSPTHALDAYLPGITVADMLQKANPTEVIAADEDHNGYARLTLTQDEVKAEWIMVDTIAVPQFRVETARTFKIKALANGMSPLTIV